MFVFGSAADSRAGAYTLLARGARQIWGLEQLPPITRQEGGKPHFPHRPDLHFNLSHSGDLALCALDGAPVGADIQIIKTTWHDQLPPRVLSGEELDWLAEQGDRWSAFTLLWTLKEARGKYTGAGLRGDIRGIAVPLPVPGQSLYLLDDLYFRTYAGDGWHAAVCGETPPPKAISWI